MNAHAFLAALHPSGYRDVRAFRDDDRRETASFRADDFVGLDAFVAKHAQWNVFFGVATRANETGRDLAACDELHALYVDIDFGKPLSEAEARERLDNRFVKPSALVRSGGGLHAYWFLTEAIKLQRHADYAKNVLLVPLAHLLGGDLSSAEPARILRMPGSFNCKPEYGAPRPVTIEYLNDARYEQSNIYRLLGEVEAPSRQVSQPLPERLPEGARNDTLYKEGSRLRRLGWNEPEILAALQFLNQSRCQPPLPQREVETIAKGCARYEPAADTFKLTEQGDAEYFAHQNKDHVRFDHRSKDWYLFTGHHWLPQSNGEVNRLVVDAVRGRQAAAARIQDSDTRKLHIKWTLGGEERRRQINIQKLAENIEPLADAGDQWDTQLDLLGVENGVVDLRTGLLRPGRPEDRITLVSPLSYSPSVPTAKWRQFILDICNGLEELADYFQVVCGYILTGETGEQCFWIFHGEGSNGKSTFLEMLARRVIPSHSWSMNFPSAKWSEAMNEYQKAQLVNRRLIVSKENEQTQRLNTEFIKSLTGDEEIQARHPYGRPFNFTPVAKFIMAVNHKPNILDESHGMWRRVRYVPFLKTFELNPTFAASLVAEAPAALAWAVAGAVRYYRDGMQTPALVMEETKKFRMESDSLAPFFEERCVVGEGMRVQAQALFDELRDWYDVRQTPMFERMSQKEFGRRIAEDARFEARKGTGRERDRTFYLGVGLRDRGQKDAPVGGCGGSF